MGLLPEMEEQRWTRGCGSGIGFSGHVNAQDYRVGIRIGEAQQRSFSCWQRLSVAARIARHKHCAEHKAVHYAACPEPKHCSMAL